MEYPAGMICQPFDDLGVLVGAVVVGNGVNDLAGRDGAFDGVEEFDEFLMGMLWHATADHGSVEDIESSEQCRGAVALVVVGHCAAFAGLQRQPRLGAVKSLDLAFLVDGHNDGMGWWVHIQADDILDLGSKLRILGLLERADAVGLKTVCPPNPLDAGQRDAGDLGHGPPRPMRRFTRRLGTGHRDDLGYRRPRNRCRARLAPGFAEQDFRSSLGEPALPAPNRGSADPASTGDFLCGQVFCREQYGLRPLNMLHWALTVTEDGGQSLAIPSIYNNADCLCHADRISWPDPFVNPLSGSVH